MDLNIEFQCAGLVILIIVLTLFTRTKNLKLTNSRLFFVALLSCFLCEILDIGSIVAIYHSTHGELSHEFTKVICKLYLMSLALQGYQGFEYASSEILASKKRAWLRWVYRLVFVVGELLIAVSDISFYMKGRIVYSYGPAALCTYGIAVIFILSTIVIALVGRNSIPLRRRKAMLVWQGCWLVAACLQFAVPRLLLVGFAAAVGMVILYSELENPNEYLDRETGCFTRSAMVLYLRDKYLHGGKFALFVARIGFMNHADYELENNAIMRAAKAILALGKEPVFYLDEGEFAVIYRSRTEMERKLEILKDMASNVKDVPAEGKYIVVPDGGIFQGAEELFLFIHNHEFDDVTRVLADEEAVIQLRKDIVVHDMIESALIEDRIEVYYQPFYDTGKKSFTAAEALVRIRDQEGNLVAPGTFIPVAERSGQIRELGIRIFEKVCSFLATGKAQALGLNCVEVNLSAVQFDHDNPTKFVLKTMKEYGIRPEWINLEITETAEADVRQVLLMNMERLSSQGIAFSLDDFGTGRANLDYFVSMPLNNVKFDLSFTQGYFVDEKIRRVVSAMTKMIHDMGMKIVSEGVETDEQMQGMLELGVDYIQGFCFSRPVPKDELLQFLKQHNSGGQPG